ncbi:MAG TPA: hypothetical protein VIH64_09180 [Streptosporangiaceae bacterium]
MTSLNAGGDTVAGPTYTVIETRNDEIVTPYTSAFLSRPHVTNIAVRPGAADPGRLTRTLSGGPGLVALQASSVAVIGARERSTQLLIIPRPRPDPPDEPAG